MADAGSRFSLLANDTDDLCSGPCSLAVGLILLVRQLCVSPLLVALAAVACTARSMAPTVLCCWILPSLYSQRQLLQLSQQTGLGRGLRVFCRLRQWSHRLSRSSDAEPAWVAAYALLVDIVNGHTLFSAWSIARTAHSSAAVALQPTRLPCLCLDTYGARFIFIHLQTIPAAVQLLLWS
eukprot:TRINITY_DN18110_c0_g1_i1.p3 TRINITY_DN18110_c0_g1~~TRINITY_DN18110_c0_g1_i1.p3  ORF type:complete len:180 (-),score=10.32 TRINITY_DN18110_c0_g1_i1:343-882(-)